MNPYEDIIDLEHFHDPNRPYMLSSERAAQFMPFKSLSGYEKYISDKANALDGASQDYRIDYDESITEFDDFNDDIGYNY